MVAPDGAASTADWIDGNCVGTTSVGDLDAAACTLEPGIPSDKARTSAAKVTTFAMDPLTADPPSHDLPGGRRL